MTEVSVVMSVHNGEEHLASALDSVLSQEGVELEVVVVDDGSTDASSKILARYAARDSRLRVIHQENAGLTKALIRGCAEAKGEFIARQDSDDLSLPGRFAAQASLLKADETLSFVSSSAEVIGPRNEVLLAHTRVPGAERATRRFLERQEGPPGHGSVMFRRDRYNEVGGYRPELYFAQDNDLWLRMTEVGRLDYVASVLYQYRIAAESISGRLHPVKVPFAKVIDELHEARLAGRSEAPILERAAKLPIRAEDNGRTRSSADQTNYFIGRCLINRSDSRALGYLVRALRMNPLNVRAMLSLPRAILLQLRPR